MFENSRNAKQNQVSEKNCRWYALVILHVVLVFLLMHYSLLTKNIQSILGDGVKYVSKGENVPPVRLFAKEEESKDYNHEENGEILLDHLVRNSIERRNEAEDVWSDLIQEGVALNHNNNKSPIVVMEVGMHRFGQCRTIAEAGLIAHCLEPSPKSFEHITNSFIQLEDTTVRERIFLYNVAAGSSTTGVISFSHMGSTGDHVGEYDMWNMVRRPQPDDFPSAKKTKLIEVPVTTLDSIIFNENKNDNNNNINNQDYNQRLPITYSSLMRHKYDPISFPHPNNNTINSHYIDSVFLLKIDTQGFEPSVFAGLQRSIQQHKIKYILFEYWPKGMDLLEGTDTTINNNNNNNNKNTQQQQHTQRCQVSVQILKQLARAGYILYPLTVSAHPKAPEGARKTINDPNNRPLDKGFTSHCQWYYDVELKFPSDEYHMGYWSDILAVAPSPKTTTMNETLPLPVSTVGKLLFERSSNRTKLV